MLDERRRAAQLRRPRRRCTRRSARATCRPRPSCSGSSASCAAARSSCRSPSPARRGPGHAAHADVGVHVEGLDDVMVRLSRCCTPVPGDEIMGFVTRGRGVSVHRTDCANAVSLRNQADRVIDVEWDNDAPGNYTVVGRDRGARPVEAAARRRRCALRAPREHHRRARRRPSPTASPGSGSTSSSPIPATSTRSSLAVKRVDSVYDATRVLPGART